jgi:hypothetical protein
MVATGPCRKHSSGIPLNANSASRPDTIVGCTISPLFFLPSLPCVTYMKIAQLTGNKKLEKEMR